MLEIALDAALNQGDRIQPNLVYSDTTTWILLLEIIFSASVTPPKRSSHPISNKRSNQIVGQLAEILVARWLTQEGAEIIQQRWHCRWGELDLIARFASKGTISSTQDTIAFVEVKARCKGNWDMDGLLSITPQKQQKLWKAAELFLTNYPQLADLPCRFDVALVHANSHYSKPIREGDRALLIDEKSTPPLDTTIDEVVEIGRSISIADYKLSLQHYIESAFELT